jgi:hypothetical protein
MVANAPRSAELLSVYDIVDCNTRHFALEAKKGDGFRTAMFRESYVPVGNLAGSLAANSWDNPRIMETSTLDLLYLERDPSTKHPSACVCVKENSRRDYGGVKGEKLITTPCLSFIELDAEIRRLHAELDEIRSRAKKKFYRAQASTAGA